MSRRNGVPEKWLANVLQTGLVVKTAPVATRLAEEQEELKGYESMAVSPTTLDDEEQVRYFYHESVEYQLSLLSAFVYLYDA